MSARVLVVDDIEQNRKLLTDKLKNEYFHVVTAVDGEDAIDKAMAEEPDVILMDIMMPKLNGIDACRRLKTDPRTEHIPIVLVTALNEREDRLRGLGAGADDFLTKPVNDLQLLSRVRALDQVQDGRRRTAQARGLRQADGRGRYFGLQPRFGARPHPRDRRERAPGPPHLPLSRGPAPSDLRTRRRRSWASRVRWST